MGKAKRGKNPSVSGRALRTINGLLDPSPGLWRFSWGLVDRDRTCRTPWPAPGSPRYAELAVFMARLCERNLSEHFKQERASGRGALHGLDSIDEPFSEAWTRIVAERGLDDDDQDAFALLSWTYCVAGRDSGRVVMAYQLDARTVYPIWWDPNHEVSGPRGPYTEADPTGGHPDCFHLESELVAALDAAFSDDD